MKKNGQYVGVDDKYIPEDEKYVENDEVKETINKTAKEAKDYIDNNQDKIKEYGKKGIKVVKGVGIAYLVFFGIVFLFIITIFVLMIIMMIKHGL